MSQEENIKQQLTGKFNYLGGNIKIQRSRRIFMETGYDKFPEVFDFAVTQLKFSHLCTITGLDEQDKIVLIYHLAQDSGILLNFKTNVSKQNPVLKTVMAYFPGAENYERELVDLMGVKVEGLPAGNRYPLTDDWPVGQFPLRKYWKPSSPDKEVNKNA